MSSLKKMPLEDNTPVPSAPPSYDQSMDPPSSQNFTPQMVAANPPYHYQPVPVINEVPVNAAYPTVPQQQILQVQGPAFPMAVGRHQMQTRCPQCAALIKSKITTDCTSGAHICCCLCFFFGCCLCSCIPYCMDSFKTVTHTCPNCNAFLGIYKPS